jgi:hypothetical protein
MWKDFFPTKEDWDQINQIDWEGVAKAHPEQVVTSDYHTRSFISFSGVDIKLWFRLHDGSYHPVSEMQGFSWNNILPRRSDSTPRAGVEGSLSFVVFDRSIEERLEELGYNHYVSKGIKDIVLYAGNEYGLMMQADIIDVRFDTISGSSTIDDLVLTETLSFSGRGVVNWRKVDRSPAYLNLLLEQE